ncbi:MAG: hypothetical protein V9G12_18680 [Microthrixaceae bacterium]
MLIALAIPMLDMRLGQADAGTDPTSTTHRRAYDLLAAGFGDGFNGPLLIVVDLGANPGDPRRSSRSPQRCPPTLECGRCLRRR